MSQAAEQTNAHFGGNWLTPRRKEIFTVLDKYEVEFKFLGAGHEALRIYIPHRAHTSAHIEIAYLIAELFDENFKPPIEYLDSYPDSSKFAPVS